jgi:hypothetical protein
VRYTVYLSGGSTGVQGQTGAELPEEPAVGDKIPLLDGSRARVDYVTTGSDGSRVIGATLLPE